MDLLIAYPIYRHQVYYNAIQGTCPRKARGLGVNLWAKSVPQ